MPDYDYQSDARPFSQVLEDIGAKADPKLYLGELVNAFGERGFGALMLFLGLVSAVIGAIPGSTTVLGLPILIIAFQLVIRRDQLWLPKWALASSIDRGGYRDAIAGVLPRLRRVERWSRPRLSVMTSEISEVLIGLACMILCSILVLPIPGGNLIPSLIIVAFGFGLVQRDGLAVLAAWTAIALVCIAGLIIWLLWAELSPHLLPVWVTVSTLPSQAWNWLTGLFGG
ncbi:MAG: exopolysaccharide biosynthesis protein [Brevundimonas sp.]|nr:exopolysaccharide biosynthesis protein [Brevundimonas sp.]